MRRIFVIGLVFALLSVTGVPTLSHAQDSFTPDEQAALNDVATALKHFTHLDTYQLTGEQEFEQVIRAYQGDDLAMTITQQITTENTMQLERQPANEFHNARMDMTQSIEMSTAIPGQKTDNQLIAPVNTNIIAVDDQLFIRMSGPPEIAAALPRGWIDITDGTAGYPALEMFDFNAVLKLSLLADVQYAETILAAVTDITILDPVTIDGKDLNHYLVAFDNSLTIEELGVESLSDMFAASPDMIDIDAFIDILLNSQDTRYTIDYFIEAQTGVLYSYEQIIQTDLDVTEAMPQIAAQGLTMTMQQNIHQTFYLSGFNEPVTITAPDLD